MMHPAEATAAVVLVVWVIFVIIVTWHDDDNPLYWD